MRPLVSVIMPAYDVSRYVDQAVRSVLAQRGVRFELLILDDGSRDGTWERVCAYRRDPRVRAWRSRRNAGAGAARNRLIARARGRYLAVCDADDFLRAGHLRRMARALSRAPRAAAVYGDLALVDAAGRPRGTLRSPEPGGHWDLVRSSLMQVGMLMRRSLVERVGGYRADMPFRESYDLLLRLAEAAPLARVAGRPLYCYRRRRGSRSDRSARAFRDEGVRVARRAILRRYGFRVPW